MKCIYVKDLIQKLGEIDDEWVGADELMDMCDHEFYYTPHGSMTHSEPRRIETGVNPDDE